MSERLTIPVKRLTETAKMPTRAKEHDAGLDLYADLGDEGEYDSVVLGEVAGIPTGVAAAIPPGYCGLIVGRSGLGKNGIDVFGGLIDSGYRGEIKVLFVKVAWTEDEYEKHMVTRDLADMPDLPMAVDIKHGDRIAQMIILPVPKVDLVEVDELPASERGTDGFASTGR